MHHASPKATNILYMKKTRALAQLVKRRCTCVDFRPDPGEVDVARRTERGGGVARDKSAPLGEFTDFRERGKDTCRKRE